RGAARAAAAAEGADPAERRDRRHRDDRRQRQRNDRLLPPVGALAPAREGVRARQITSASHASIARWELPGLLRPPAGPAAVARRAALEPRDEVPGLRTRAGRGPARVERVRTGSARPARAALPRARRQPAAPAPAGRRLAARARGDRGAAG